MPRRVDRPVRTAPAPVAGSIVVEATGGFRGDATRVLPLTVEDFLAGMDRWEVQGMCVQDAFPTLNAGQREFLMTGMTPKVWDKTFNGDPEDN